MACPNGCIGGAGQPKATIDEKKERSVNLYNADKLCTLKRSEENPLMDKLYEGILKGREHELLHVSYVKWQNSINSERLHEIVQPFLCVEEL